MTKNIVTESNLNKLLKFFSKIDWLMYASVILLVISIFTILTLYIFPIYPDEIQSRFWLSRLPYDFPEKISAAPTCQSTFSQPLPITMILPGIVNWLLHGLVDNLQMLRIVGMLIAFAWIAGLFFYFRKHAFEGLDPSVKAAIGLRLNLRILGLFIALFFLGVFPFFLITNRGEQILIPSVIILLMVSIFSEGLPSSGQIRKKIALAFLYFFGVSLILYSHAKGLLLTPFMIVVGWRLFKRFQSPLVWISSAALFFGHVWQSYSAWKFAFQCNEVPAMAETLKSYSIDPTLLFRQPAVFFPQVWQSILQFNEYINQLGFQQTTDISYLPPVPLDAMAQFSNLMIGIILAAIFLAAIILLPYQYVRNDASKKRWFSHNLVLLVLLGCALISSTLNLTKNWYDAGYLYSLVLICLIFYIGENHKNWLLKKWSNRIMLCIIVVSTLSQMQLIYRDFPYFNAGYQGASISLAKYNDQEVKKALNDAANMCHIDPDKSSNLIIDDYTYLFFQKSRRPMAITYIRFDLNEEAVRKFISESDSDGMIIHCSGIPAAWVPYAHQSGSVCCVSREDLKR